MQKPWYFLFIFSIVILAAGIAGWYFLNHSPSDVSSDTLVISTGSPEFSALTLVADKKGFFTKYRLNVTIRDYPTGVGAVNDLMQGNADLAYAAEFVGVSLLGKYPDLRIIGCTAECDVISIVSRNDRGIATPKDLKGKSIAVPKNTQAEFFLGRYLALNGIEITDIRIHYVDPADLVDSVVSGNDDAAIIWEPYAFIIGKQLGRNSTTFPAQRGQRFYWVTYTRPDVIRNRPDVLTRYFKALDEAGSYFNQNEKESKAVIREHVNLPEDYVDSLFKNNQYALSLDQSLIIAMEDESRWMISNNLTTKKAVPNYLDYITTEPLRTVNPRMVNIIRSEISHED
jgi:NitT/TauT family transport system substrate-binding protein